MSKNYCKDLLKIYLSVMLLLVFRETAKLFKTLKAVTTKRGFSGDKFQTHTHSHHKVISTREQNSIVG